GTLANSDICIGYGILIEAEFGSLTIRSVPGQDEPYPPLTDVIANQTTMVLHNVTGTIVGFLFSDSIEGANLPGFHMHFISEDLSYGGHVLDFSVDDTVMIASQLHSVTVTMIDG
ncbi:MAG: acetolactate decarboxylase, partial [Methanomassiliicoccales archaeon]|nr:acetolactate decarboxylase [Methanomassiliicoccales archaeon]